MLSSDLRGIAAGLFKAAGERRSLLPEAVMQFALLIQASVHQAEALERQPVPVAFRTHQSGNVVSVPFGRRAPFSREPNDAA
jgi:hypothetical protein